MGQYTVFGYSHMNERYNGILEQQPSNNRSIEIQLMSRFIRDNNAYTMQPPLMYREELQSLVLLQPSLTGSLLMTTRADDIVYFSEPMYTSYFYEL